MGRGRTYAEIAAGAAAMDAADGRMELLMPFVREELETIISDRGTGKSHFAILLARSHLAALDRVEWALELAVRHGGHDGAHHKDWVIDQMVRILAGDRYEQVVRDACRGDDGPDSYTWGTGVPP